jgi:hypothetical protein
MVMCVGSAAFASNLLVIPEDPDGSLFIVPYDTTDWSGGDPTVVGWHAQTAGTKAFVWTTSDSQAVTLPNRSGCTGDTKAWSVSNDGTVIGGTDYSSVWYAVEFHRGSAATDMTTDQTSSESFELAYATGDESVGWAQDGGETNGGARFDLTADLTSNDGGAIAAPYIAYGISSDGTYSCGTARNPQAKKAYVNRNGTLVYMGNSTVQRNEAWYVSDDGSRAVGLYDTDLESFEGTTGKIWDWNGSAYVESNFPTIPGCGTNTSLELTGMSADGTRIVGNMKTSLSGWVSFLYDSGTMYTLDQVVSMYSLDVPSGEALEYIMGISPDGETICGLMTTDGGHDGFVAHIPEPATLSLLLVGALALLRRRR